ncbi:hypothetical protein DPSP01_005536 [Paraphaeosphaeria sporulosa]
MVSASFSLALHQRRALQHQNYAPLLYATEAIQMLLRKEKGSIVPVTHDSGRAAPIVTAFMCLSSPVFRFVSGPPIMVLTAIMGAPYKLCHDTMPTSLQTPAIQ